MKFSVILAVILLFGGCRFQQRVVADALAPDPRLAGTWQSERGGPAIVVRSLGDGRYRMLMRQGESGLVFDAHVVQLGKRRLLQANLMASLDKAGKLVQPLAGVPSWSLMVVDVGQEELSVRWLTPAPELDRAGPGFARAIEKRLADDQALEAPVQYRRIAAPGSGNT